jgi:hypothetical protein
MLPSTKFSKILFNNNNNNNENNNNENNNNENYNNEIQGFGNKIDLETLEKKLNKKILSSNSYDFYVENNIENKLVNKFENKNNDYNSNSNYSYSIRSKTLELLLLQNFNFIKNLEEKEKTKMFNQDLKILFSKNTSEFTLKNTYNDFLRDTDNNDNKKNIINKKSEALIAEHNFQNGLFFFI